jgi:beta-lactamase regulating signal transducer with metallopeptidase domain
MRYNSEFKERRTMMDIRREYDKKMRRECIWGAVVMVAMFVIMVAMWAVYG